MVIQSGVVSSSFLQSAIDVLSAQNLNQPYPGDFIFRGDAIFRTGHFPFLQRIQILGKDGSHLQSSAQRVTQTHIDLAILLPAILVVGEDRSFDEHGIDGAGEIPGQTLTYLLSTIQTGIPYISSFILGEIQTQLGTEGLPRKKKNQQYENVNDCSKHIGEKRKLLVAFIGCPRDFRMPISVKSFLTSPCLGRAIKGKTPI
jgi:hypothetical protein